VPIARRKFMSGTEDLSETNFLPNRVGGYWEEPGFEWFAGI